MVGDEAREAQLALLVLGEPGPGVVHVTSEAVSVERIVQGHSDLAANLETVSLRVPNVKNQRDVEPDKFDNFDIGVQRCCTITGEDPY